MGLWSKICSLGRSIKSGVQKAYNKVKECVTNVWNKFTGKDKFKEAEELYREITDKYNNRRRRFEEEVDEYINKIEKHVCVINKSKEKIKLELFTKMAEKLKNIKDISLSKDFSVEQYIKDTLTFDNVRSKSKLYKIDFNKHKVKTTFQAIFTLGFFTRKKAKETLYAVQEEEAKINCEIEKMNAEVVKLKAIEASLDNVEYYFTNLIDMFENLLIRLDNSVNFLFVRSMTFAHRLIGREMSIKKLPIMQRKEVEAIFTMSKILKEMTDTQIIEIEDDNKVKKYDKNLKVKYDSFVEGYKAA